MENFNWPSFLRINQERRYLLKSVPWPFTLTSFLTEEVLLFEELIYWRLTYLQQICSKSRTCLMGCLIEFRRTYEEAHYISLYFELWFEVLTFKNNSHSSTINLICDIISQIGCGYQNSKSHDRNDEIMNLINFLGTIHKTVFKACGSCYFIA